MILNLIMEAACSLHAKHWDILEMKKHVYGYCFTMLQHIKSNLCIDEKKWE